MREAGEEGGRGGGSGEGRKRRGGEVTVGRREARARRGRGGCVPVLSWGGERGRRRRRRPDQVGKQLSEIRPLMKVIPRQEKRKTMALTAGLPAAAVSICFGNVRLIFTLWPLPQSG